MMRAATTRFTVLKSLAVCLIAAGLLVPLRAYSVPSARPEDVGFSSERLQRIADTIQRHIDARNIAGAVTLVASGGRIAHFEAHGLTDLESKKPMTKDTVFRIMSMTKPVTAVAVMMLEEEGRLRVTDPVSKYLPEFTHVTVGDARAPVAREITIAHLLTHTSGLPNGNIADRSDDTLAAAMPRLAQVPLSFQPGSEWAYSGLLGPDVLARIVEIVSGQPYDRFLRERIFDPLGMKETSHYPSDAQRPRVATLYTRTATGLVPRGDTYSSRTYFSGSAGLLSTAEDYLQFAQMLANGGELNGRRLLKAETVRRIATNHVGDLFNGKLNFPNRGVGFGYLVALIEDSRTAAWPLPDGTFGWFGAYGTQVWINPKERFVTLLMVQKFQGLSLEVQRDFDAAVAQARLK
jgi:CubicO group peptidase (beta-lactamase class C family)